MVRVRMVARGPGAWFNARRRWAIGLMLALVTGSVLVTALPRLALATARQTATTVGVDDGQMQAAVTAAGWPQQGHTWCGIATIAAIANFLGTHVSQGDVTNVLNSDAARSQWGTPSWNGIGPGVAADIARDSGTDPRALAEGMRYFSGAWYSQMVDQWGAWDATGQLAADLEHDHQPISVIVDGGQHSVVVSKIFANGDPAWNAGAITGLEVWDPGVGASAGIQGYTREVVSLGTWLYSGVYWGSVYDDYLDPDPAVGPYTYDPSIGNYNHLWTGHYVYIRPGGISGVSVDWAVTQNWLVIAGQHGELPPGYQYPPTPTPLPTATPTNLPTRVVRFAPTTLPTPLPTPLPTAVATTVPRPTATATPVPVLSLSAQSLCVESTCLETGFAPWWAVAALALPLTMAALLLLYLGIRRRAKRRDPPRGPPTSPPALVLVIPPSSTTP